MRPFHHHPIYHRFWALTALNFLFGISYGVFSLALPLRAESLFFDVAILGIIFAAPELFGVFIDVPLGAFANRFGRRKLIFYSGILLCVTAVLFISTKSLILFTAVLIFYEFATQSFIIPGAAELIAISPNRVAGRFNSISEGLHNLGFSAGSVIAGALIAIQLSNAFIFAGAVALVMVFLSVTLFPLESRRENLTRSVVNVFRKDHLAATSFREVRFLGFGGIFLIGIYFVFAFHWGFIALLEPVYTDALGLDPIFIGLIYAGFTFPIFFVSLLVGRYVDHRGAKGVIVTGLFLMALSSFGFFLTSNPILLFILSLVAGVGDAFLLPAVDTLLDRLSANRVKERIVGVKVFAESLGYFLGPLLAGLLAAMVGFPGTFLLFGFFALCLSLASSFVSLGRGDTYEALPA